MPFRCASQMQTNKKLIRKHFHCAASQPKQVILCYTNNNKEITLKSLANKNAQKCSAMG